MSYREPAREIRIDLGNGTFAIINAQLVMSGPSVPRPRPKLLKMLLDLGAGEVPDGSEAKLEIEVSVEQGSS